MSIRKNGLIIIEDKIFSKADIQNLSKIIWDSYTDAKTNCASPQFNVYVKCFDTVSYDSDTTDIFNDGSQIYNENIKSIEIMASCEKALNVRVRLQHGYESIKEELINISEIEIGSDKIAKIHDMQGKLNDYLKGLEAQDNVIYKTRKIVQGVLFIVATLSFGFLIDKFNSHSLNYTKFWVDAIADTTSFIGAILLAGVFGGLLAVGLYDNFFIKKSKHLWPTVELQIGRRNYEKQRKTFFIGIIMLVIIPLILAIMYDIMKAFI